MSSKVLIIDDDRKLNSLLKEYLRGFGFSIRAAETPAQGLEELRRELPDIIILDVMLPDIDGFEVCRRIRNDYSVPVIMLTARGEVTDRVVGLEMGADDYLPKPFEPRELVARMQSVLRRGAQKVPEKTFRCDGLEVDFGRRRVLVEGTEAVLTAMEFALLSLLVRNRGMVLSRDLIFDRLKGLEDDTCDRSIDVLVSRLRHKLNDDPKKPRYLKTVRGTGYTFTA